MHIVHTPYLVSRAYHPVNQIWGQNGLIMQGLISYLSLAPSFNTEYAPEHPWVVLMVVKLAAQPSQTSKLVLSP